MTLSGPIIGNLIDKYNQKGYDGNNSLKYGIDSALDQQHHLLTMGSVRKVKMYCNDPNSLKIKSEMETSIVHSDNLEREEDKLSISFELTVESKNDEEDITYKDGKLSLTVPKKLKNYKIGDKNLFDVIKEYFQKFCEKLGFKFETKIEHNLEAPLSNVKEVKQPTNGVSTTRWYVD